MTRFLVKSNRVCDLTGWAEWLITFCDHSIYRFKKKNCNSYRTNKCKVLFSQHWPPPICLSFLLLLFLPTHPRTRQRGQTLSTPILRTKTRIKDKVVAHAYKYYHSGGRAGGPKFKDSLDKTAKLASQKRDRETGHCNLSPSFCVRTGYKDIL